MKLKIPFLMIFGAVVLVAGACGITGCSSNGDEGVPPSSAVTDDTVDDSGLPPDPGEAGKATLTGIDSDDDGVRDDVQRYIALTYPDSEKTRAALTQYAKVRQDSLLDTNDKEKSIQHFEEIFRSLECLTYVEITGSSYKDVEKELESVMLNTDERNNAYLDYLERAGSLVIPATPYSEWVSTCEFDVSALLN